MYPIVKTIKRINTLNKGIIRIPTDDKYDDIYDKLIEKRESLVTNIKMWIHEDGLLRTRGNRRKQIKLACKLLGIDSYAILRSSI